MVLDISIQAMDDQMENTYQYQTYTTRIDDHRNVHRILTVVTGSDQTLRRWLNDLLKFTPKTHPLIVSVAAESHSLQFLTRGAGPYYNALPSPVLSEYNSYRKNKDLPYAHLTLCSNSHCLIFFLPTPEEAHYKRSLHSQPNLKPLRTFFQNPRVLSVGIEIDAIANKLNKEIGIEMKNVIDLRGMAVQGLKKEGDNLDLWHYDIDKLAKTVLGKHFDVMRPTEEVEWYYDDYYHRVCYRWWQRELTDEKVQFSTVDAFLSFLIGSHLHHKIHGGDDDDAQGSFNKKKKKKKNKNKE